MKNESIDEVRQGTESYERQLSNAPSNIEKDPRLGKNVGVKFTTPVTPHASCYLELCETKPESINKP